MFGSKLGFSRFHVVVRRSWALVKSSLEAKHSEIDALSTRTLGVVDGGWRKVQAPLCAVAPPGELAMDNEIMPTMAF